MDGDGWRRHPPLRVLHAEVVALVLGDGDGDGVAAPGR
jgi:hypothetical protein